MKRQIKQYKLSNLLFLHMVLLFLGAASVNAQVWQYVGDPLFGEGLTEDMAVSSVGEPYVVYVEDISFDITVKKIDGNAWVDVGNPGFATSLGLIAPVIALDTSDTPYVAFEDNNLPFPAITVMSYNGFFWDSVGIPGFIAVQSDNNAPGLAIYDNTPYVAVKDANNQGRVTVLMYDGFEWLTVGNAGFSPTAALGPLQLAFSTDGTPYVGFIGDSFPFKVNVMAYNPGTQTWEAVGNPDFTDTESFVSMAMDGDTPYVAFKDPAVGGKASCMRFNGIAWEYVGPQGFTPDPIGTFNSYMPDLAVYDNNPYLAYWNDNFELNVRRFSSNNWTLLGMEGFASLGGSIGNISLELYNGIPYLSFVEFDTISFMSGNSVMKIPEDLFITTWETTAVNETVSIPAFGTGYTINWGDGTVESGLTGIATHVYATPGIHFVTIEGGLDRIDFGSGGDNDKIRTVEQWGTAAWTTFEFAFSGCSDLTFNAIDQPDLTNVTDMALMFFECPNFNSDISRWDVSGVTDMRGMFQSAAMFNQPLNEWDVSNVTNMDDMFSGAAAFNQPLNNWDVSSVTDMQFMFSGAAAFNQPLNNWDVSSVTNIPFMFFDAAVFNQPLNNWDVSSVTNMRAMFGGAAVFNQPLNNWDVSSVTNMSGMFSDAAVFNQPLNNWDVSSVTDMSNMFSDAAVFNQPLNNWDVSNVTDMDGMFFIAGSFDQDLGAWDLTSVTDMGLMLTGAGLSINNYDNTLIGWAGGTSIPFGISLGADGLEYCAGEAARTSLINDHGWTINGDNDASPEAIIASSTTQLDCNNPSIDLDAGVSNPVGFLDLLWSTGSNSNIITVTGPGDYTVTVTNTVNGCTDTETITITEDTAEPTAIITSSTTQLDCNNPSIDLDAGVSLPVGQLNLLWSTGSTSNILTVTDPGDYTVTVTNTVNGCTDTETINITEDTAVPAAIITSPTTQLDCDNPSIDLDAGTSMPVGQLDLLWSTGSTSNIITVTSPGDYTVTVTNTMNGCTDTETITITEDTALPTAIITSPTTQLDCDNPSIDLDAGTSMPVGQLDLLWSTGSTSNIITVTDPGDYTVTVTNTMNGCTDAETVTITEDTALPTAIITSPTTQLDCDNPSIDLDAGTSMPVGQLDLLWSTGSTSNIITVTSPGDYTVTVTNTANGCTDTETVTITEDTAVPTAIITSPTTQLDCDNPSIDLDAGTSMPVGQLDLLWSTGSTSNIITVTTPGDYAVTVTNTMNGCTDAETITITEDTAVPTAIITSPTTQLDCDNPSIDLDAGTSMPVGQLDLLWSTGSTSNIITVTTPGDYTVTVTNTMNGCTDAETITITEDPAVPTAIITSPTTQLDCDNPSIDLDAGTSMPVGQLDLLWSTGSTSNIITVTTPGDYTVTVTNTANGCTDTETVTITEDTAVPTAIITSPTTQLDCDNPSIDLDAGTSMPVGQLDLLWSTGSTSNIITVTTPGDYAVTVTNTMNGCTDAETVTITQDTALPTAIITAPTTQLDCDNPSIDLDAGTSMPVGQLDLLWSTGSTSNIITVTTPGDYTVTVTNTMNGCTDAETITITEDPAVPTAIITSPTTQLDCDNPSIDLDAGTSMPVGQLDLLWSTGSTSNIITVTTPGDYTVTVTNTMNGCTDAETITITEDPAVPTAIITSPTTQLDCDNPSIDLDAGTSMPVGQLDLLWSTGSTSNIITVTDPGDYTVTVTNTMNGCTDTETVTITQDTALPTAIITSPTTQLDCDNPSIDLDAGTSMPVGQLDLLWSTGSTSNIITVTTPGDYTVTVTNTMNGCTDAETITITEDPAVPTAIITSPTTQLDCDNPSIDLDAGTSMPVGQLDLLWSTGSTSNIITVTTPGDYTVTVTNTMNGCTDTETITITEDPAVPTAIITSPTTQLDCDNPSIDLDAGTSMPVGQLDLLWSTGSTSNIITVTDPGDYTVTVTNTMNGCTDTETVTITQDTALPTAIITSPTTQLDCDNPSIDLDAGTSMPVGQLDLLWSTGSTSNIITVTDPGDYTVTVTNTMNGCTDTETVTITADPAVPAAIIIPSATQLDCNIASIQLDAGTSLPVGQLDLLWSTGSTSNIITVTTPGDYTVTVTNTVNGCTDTQTITIIENSLAPTATIDAPVTQLDCNTSSILLDASGSTGQGALSFQWNSGTGGPAPDAYYRFEGNTDDFAGTNHATAVNGPTYITGQVGQAISLDGVDQHVTLPSGMFDSYNDFTFAAWVKWEGPTTSVWERIFDFGNNTTQYMALSPRSFFNTMRFIITTTGPGGQQVLEAPPLSVDVWTHVAVVLNGNTGTLYVNGVAADVGTISIDPSDIAPALNYLGRSQFSADPYLDGQIDDVQLFNFALSPSEIDEVINGGGGSTSSTVEVILPGDYSVTITDAANGCTDTETLTITEDTAVPTAIITAPTNQLDCDNPSIDLDAGTSLPVGQLDLLWSTGSTSNIITVNDPGDYTVTVTNTVNGCTDTETITITEDPAVPSAIIISSATLLDCNTTSIQLDAGTSLPQGLLDLSWSTGSTSNIITITTPGDYTVTVTNTTNGCTDTETVTITQDITSPAAMINTPVTQLDCNNSLLTLDASGSSGQGSLTYEWYNGSTDSSVIVVLAGTYSVTVTDTQNGCTEETSVTITENFNFPTAAIDAPATQLDCDDNSITLDASVSTGQASLDYLWSTGETSATIEVTAVGDYTVTVTDTQNGCFNSQTITITQDFTPPTAVITPPATTLLDCNMPTLTLDAGGSSGQGALLYSWTGGTTGPSLVVADAGNYVVTVTDTQNGCTAEAVQNIVADFLPPTVTIETPLGTQLDCNIDTLTLDASSSTGQGTLSYLWTGGATTPFIDVIAPGTYAVTVTDGQNGCTAANTQDVEEIFLSVTVNSNQPVCLNEDLELSVANIAVTYSWEGPNGYTSNLQNPTIMGIGLDGDGTYSVTITDASGCTGEAFVDVTVNPLPVISLSGTEVLCEAETIVLSETGGDAIQWDWTGPDNFSGDQETVTITDASELATGQYQVIVTDINGCTAEDQIGVVVNPFPAINIVTTSPICSGEDLALSETAGEAIAWEWTAPDGEMYTTADVFIEGGQAVGGVYNLQVTSPEGCTATGEVTVTVLSGSQIESNFLVGGSACTGDTIRFIDYSIFDSLTTVEFLWDFGNGDTSTERDPLYVYTVPGVYDVNVEILSGECPNISIDKTIGVFECLQVDEGYLYATLTPTLNNGTFEVFAQLIEEGDLLVEIFDFSGQRVHSKFYDNVQLIKEEIHLQNPGLYFVQIGYQTGVEILQTIVVK